LLLIRYISFNPPHQIPHPANPGVPDAWQNIVNVFIKGIPKNQEYSECQGVKNACGNCLL
jgi:hypothetical protein